MTKQALLINAHEQYPFAEGKLNAELTRRIGEHLALAGYELTTTTMRDDYVVEDELRKHAAAQVVVLQSPVNWMGVPWTFKRYMDAVYTAGMDGTLCQGDGRTRQTPKHGYGTGGTLKNTRYMVSLTFNAPREAFDDTEEWLFEGRGVDDLLFPMHMNFRFFGMTKIPTFACFDVMKNPDVASDFARLATHLNEHFPISEIR